MRLAADTLPSFSTSPNYTILDLQLLRDECGDN